jgi:hypothetical protein
MTSIIAMLFHPLPNAIMTLLLGLSALYWLLTFIAGDFLADINIDADLGVDLDSEMDGDIATEPSYFQKALSFINIGKVPIMVVLSMFKFIAWLFTLASSLIWNIADRGWKSALILIPIFIITYFLTRWATKPFIKIYHQMGYNGEEAHDLIGRIATLKSNIKDDILGTAELKIKNDVIKILVKSKTGQAIQFNAEVNIISESIDKKFYWVTPEINLNNVL